MGRNHGLTEEAKVALKIAKALDQVTLDIENVGIELARLRPMVHYNRVMIMAEAAADEQEGQNDSWNTFF
jgi:hypothetical protein